MKTWIDYRRKETRTDDGRTEKNEDENRKQNRTGTDNRRTDNKAPATRIYNRKTD
jgi:hypothetical protein